MEQPNEDGLSPVAYLCSKICFKAREYRLLKRLLEAGSTPDPTPAKTDGCPPLSPLRMCALRGGSWRIKAAELLLSFGANPNAACPIQGHSPLASAVAHPPFGGEAELVALLARYGANPNLADWQGRSPLHKAALWGQDLAVLALLEGGARAQARDLNGASALDLARERGSSQCERVIASWMERLELGSEVSTRRSARAQPRL